VYSGYEASSQVSVTQSTQFGAGVTIGISATIFMVSIGSSVAVSTSITNTKSSSVRKTSSSAVMSTVRIKPVIGNNCYVRLHYESCSYTSDGSVPILGTGYVFFKFKNKVKGRTVIGYNIEQVLTVEQRSVPIPLSISIDTKANGDFDSNCECVDQECLALKSKVKLDEAGRLLNSTTRVNPIILPLGNTTTDLEIGPHRRFRHFAPHALTSNDNNRGALRDAIEDHRRD